jgi:hypothetical protein
MTVTQPTLFKLKNPFPFDRNWGFTLLGFQPPIPGHDEGTKNRVAGLDDRVGLYKGTGYVPREEISGGYVIFLEFENGSIEAFHPFSLFPVIDKEEK